ncbi:hypothetical protein RK09_06360 [Kocuria rhizophila]|nr:hypothetical protein RK09_06360 [Kocuria rhizophila]
MLVVVTAGPWDSTGSCGDGREADAGDDDAPPSCALVAAARSTSENRVRGPFCARPALWATWSARSATERSTAASESPRSRAAMASSRGGREGSAVVAHSSRPVRTGEDNDSRRAGRSAGTSASASSSSGGVLP